jgi:hypothetical protein
MMGVIWGEVLLIDKRKQSVFGTDMGCQSYTFYPEEGTDAPRCDLFGGSVAQSLDSVNRWVPNVWFDLGCGAPPRG